MTTSISVEDRLASFASTEVIDGEALEMMRLSAFDWAGCALAGRAEPVAEILRKKGLSEGGAPEAVVIGGGELPCARAALINGASSHALDYDDTHFDHIGHTSVGVVPAALAVAQAQGATMAQFLDAALIGSEAAVRIGVWLGRHHYQVGFHQTATAGAFGAALAALRLMGATPNQMVAGLGLAATRASGLKSQFGTMGKPLNAGLAAETGVEAALWAMAGLTSADQGLSGPLGFGATHHGISDDAGFDALGRSWRMKNVSHKFHACCHGLHAMLEALDTLDVDAGQVRSVKVTTHQRWMTVCNKEIPRTGLEAKFSYAQTAAMKLLGVDTASISSFSDEVVTRPSIVQLRNRVAVSVDDQLSEMQAQVEVALDDGTVRNAFHDLAAPIALAERAAKLKLKAHGLLGAAVATALWDAIANDDLMQFTAIINQKGQSR